MQEWFAAVDSPNVVAKFEDVEVLDGAKSREVGANVYKSAPALHARVTGHSDVSVQLVTAHNLDAFRARFPGAFEAYQGKERPALAGTPLEAMGLPRSRCLVYQVQGFSTVEQVAAMSDSTLQAMGPGSMAIREAARAFLEERVRESNEIVKEAAAEIVAERKRRKAGAA